MRLDALTATAHPRGNRIELRWRNPDIEHYPGVRVMRREGTYPVGPDDGVLVALGSGLEQLVDQGLRSETVYYYMLFPYGGDPPDYSIDLANRVSATATGPYDYAGQMSALLPAIYQRYDTTVPTVVPGDMAPEDVQRGQLRRFLDLPGGQLDQLHSMAKALLDAHDTDRVDGAMLPLLARWIGWETDYRIEIAKQRSELRYAPFLYQAISLIPTVEATIKRLLGWESRTKEFLDNVFLSNTPERLNLWLSEFGNGQWDRSDTPLSLNFAYEGRPASALDANGALWLFFHTLRRGPSRESDRWDLWCKHLDAIGWSPSTPAVRGEPMVKYPAAASQGDGLWLFWRAYQPDAGRWRIDHRIRAAGDWSPVETFPQAGPDARQPCALTDESGQLWLFWVELDGGRWQVRYNVRTHGDWAQGVPWTMPPHGADDPRVEGDLFALAQPWDPQRKLWLFWIRREPAATPGQTRWRIVYRFKAGLNPGNSGDWSELRTLPTPNLDHDDREPSALARADGSIELFWSSTRDGSWSIWRSTLDPASNTWTEPERVTINATSQRGPLSVRFGTRTLVIYGGNDSLPYASPVYTATQTLDTRYGGSTTVDSRNLAKNALRGRFEDFQAYIYDAGRQGVRTNASWYARDTVGIYLTPSTENPELIQRNQRLLEGALQPFLPIQTRAVFIIQQPFFRERVYTYDDPEADPQRKIREVAFDQVIPEVYPRVADKYADTVPGWSWLRSWSQIFPDGRTVDSRTVPVSTKWRTWHEGLTPGG